jgi:predicted nucleic acid-binding protein
VPIPAHLIDSNILLRISRRDDPDHLIVDAALARLASEGTLLYYTHQNIAEFWNVATRPADRNGFGLTPADADREVIVIEKGMVLLPDREDIYHEWRRLVVTHAVSGVQVHDARLAAAMRVHGVARILTLNPGDFARFPGIVAVHPASLVHRESRP